MAQWSVACETSAHRVVRRGAPSKAVAQETCYLDEAYVHGRASYRGQSDGIRSLSSSGRSLYPHPNPLPEGEGTAALAERRDLELLTPHQVALIRAATHV